MQLRPGRCRSARLCCYRLHPKLNLVTRRWDQACLRYPHRLPVIGQAASTVGDVGHVQPHVAGQLLLKRQRIVLVSRQRQAVLCHGNGRRVVRHGGIDERRQLHTITTASRMRIWVECQCRGKPLSKRKAGYQSVRYVGSRRIRLETDSWLTNELVKGNTRVIDAVPAPDGTLVRKTKAKPTRGPQASWTGSSKVRPFPSRPREDHGAGYVPGSGVRNMDRTSTFGCAFPTALADSQSAGRASK